MVEAIAGNLCKRLIAADSEDEVVAILDEAGYWGDTNTWRYYDDNENNYSTIGNQQSRPDAAVVEKLVNAIDARLINECLLRQIDPEGSKAPQDIHSAVVRFFEENPNSITAGLISEWPDKKRTDIGKGITLTASGSRPGSGKPCLTISDCGEGQTPDMMPLTFLSLTKSNKLRIPFVQGKFNMGGTGVLKFCGQRKLQLIVTKRNPALLRETASSSDGMWGFTVVRREQPSEGRRNSVFTYLAPLGADSNPRKGEVLRFSSKQLSIFPEGRDPYRRASEWGTLVKLYDYGITGSHILRKDGLLSRLDLLLPSPALPMRLYECRSGYRGHAGSFETTLSGIQVRLEDDKADNLESGFPTTGSIRVAGEQLTLKLCAFKKDKADTYRKNEGILFVINGQTHGHLTTDFFKRKKVGYSYLADSILAIVDCSRFTATNREELFMNSRDRLSAGELRNRIEEVLEDELRNHTLLRQLVEQRRREALQSSIGQSKPLEEILQSILKKNPTLSKIFLEGLRLSNPFKTENVKSRQDSFVGSRYPTYFKFKGKEYGAEQTRNCHINMRCRLTFETDAANDYFDRDTDPGYSQVMMENGDGLHDVNDYALNLQNGIATLNLPLPSNCRVNSEHSFLCRVGDSTRIAPFENRFTVTVMAPTELKGRPGSRRAPPGVQPGNDRERPSALDLPEMTEVFRDGWDKHGLDQYSALKIVNSGLATAGKNKDVYDFFINMDNLFLNSEIKTSPNEAEVIRARYKFGMVLIGMSLIHQEIQTNGHTNEKTEDEAVNLEDRVASVTAALGSVLLPMIDTLGTLDTESELFTDYSGEST